MNPTIVKIIDLMFRGIPETEETAAIREELLTNSQARYEDLLAAGESPNTALGQVLDSLRGMEDVLDEYRNTQPGNAARSSNHDEFPFARFERMAEEIDKKFENIADKAEATVQTTIGSAVEGLRSAVNSVGELFSQPETAYDSAAAPQPAASPLQWQAADDMDTLFLTFSPAQTPRLNLQLTGEDIQVEPSPDGLIHVEISKADENLYLVENVGGCLNIRRNPEGVIGAASRDQQPEQLEGFGGILSGISQALKNVLKVTQLCGDTLRLLLPHGMEQITLLTTSGDIGMAGIHPKALAASTTSGDVDVSGCVFTGTVSLNSTSGDLDVEDTRFCAPVSLNTTSGDMSLRASAPQLTVNTTSGDLELAGDIPALRANSVSGDMDICITGQLDSCTVHTTSGDLTISVGEGLVPAVHTQTVSGDVELLIPTRPDAASVIHASSVSGDLTIANF